MVREPHHDTSKHNFMIICLCHPEALEGQIITNKLKEIMLKRPIRVLIAKVGLDGHDRGAKVIASAFKDAGMEVIYTGLRQTPEMIINTAIQEDVDVIGISILSGAHNTVFPKIKSMMEKEGMDDVLLTGGGVIPEEDIKELESKGVGKLFTPGTPLSETIEYIKNWVATNRKN